MYLVKVLLLFVLGWPPRTHIWPLSTLSPPTKQESSIDLPLLISPSIAHLWKIINKKCYQLNKVIINCRFGHLNSKNYNWFNSLNKIVRSFRKFDYILPLCATKFTPLKIFRLLCVLNTLFSTIEHFEGLWE